jgi:hypothetical protein
MLEFVLGRSFVDDDDPARRRSRLLRRVEQAAVVEAGDRGLDDDAAVQAKLLLRGPIVGDRRAVGPTVFPARRDGKARVIGQPDL